MYFGIKFHLLIMTVLKQKRIYYTKVIFYLLELAQLSGSPIS